MEGKNYYRCNLDDVGLYDEAEEMEKMMNSLKEEGEMLGEKKGIKKGVKQGAKEREKAIAKTMLKAGESVNKIMSYTGLSKKQIAKLM